jgi:hypothetical protein
MSSRINTDAILIDNPLKLLYWLVFRGLALRRYARSIHEDLDEDLKVWEVREEVGDDPRFRALCRARTGLLVFGPLLSVLFFGVIFAALTGFNWNNALPITIGWVVGTFVSDEFRWRLPRQVYLRAISSSPVR